MGVSIHGYADVCVSHDVLQCVWIHPGFRHIGAEGVSAHMRGYLRHPILIQKQKSDIVIYHRLHPDGFPICDYSSKTGSNLFRHRDIPDVFFLSPILLRKEALLPAGKGIFLISLRFCNTGERNLATGGAEKVLPSFTTTTCMEQNARWPGVGTGNKKLQIIFRHTASCTTNGRGILSICEQYYVNELNK